MFSHDFHHKVLCREASHTNNTGQINGQRIKAGKSSVGFLNPTLYAHPEVLNDIVNGTNAGCGTNGFPAARG